MGSETVIVSRDLASFVSEAELPETPFNAEPAKHPLWQFPEEARLTSPAAASDRVKPRSVPVYPALAAGVFVVATAGTWGGLMLASRPVASDAPSRAMVLGPVANPPAGESKDLPATLIDSGALPPPARTPVATIVPSLVREDTQRIATASPNGIALLGAAPETRQTQESAISMARGTSGAASALSTPAYVPRPSPEPISNAPMVTLNPATRTPAPEPPPAVEAPAVSTPASRLPAPATRTEPEALPSVVARSEQNEIQRTLGQYRNAYQLLDAESAQAVWPSVDVRALARAFDSLTSQQLEFDTCQVDVAGEAATAQCRGSATYTPKVGKREPKSEPRQWTFQLRKVGEDWKIQSAQTRR